MRTAPRVPLAIVTTVGVVLALVTVVRDGPTHLATAFAFGGLITIGELLRVSAPGDRQFAPLAAGAGIGYALLVVIAPAQYGASYAQVVAVTAVASLAGFAPRLVVEGRTRLDMLAHRILSVSIVAGVMKLVAAPLHDRLPPALLLLVLLSAFAVRFLVESIVSTLYAFRESGGRLGTLLRDEAACRVPFHVIGALLAVIFALTVHVVGLAGLLVAVMPVAATQAAILRWSTVRATRLQTVRSLSRIPELGGYVEPGHTRRVSALVQSLARELGIPERRSRELYLAALMHDIGQVSMDDPVPGGTTSLLSLDHQHRIARLGADVIREGGGLDEVARIVERSADAYRRADGRRDQVVPLESRIIKVANAYDDLVGESADPDAQLHAVERLELGLSRDFDPDVTGALARLIERRQRLAVGS